MQAKHVVEDVSRDLNDQEPGYEYTRWTRGQLMSYLREAVADAASYAKDLFLKRLSVALAPGGGWQKACSCTEVLKVEGMSDADGRVYRTLQRIPDDDLYEWDGGAAGKCADPTKWEGRGYVLNSADPSEFMVTPPMPGGMGERYVSVRCFSRPDAESIGYDYAVPGEILAAVKQWMLYRALSVDSENNAAITELANRHRASYTDLVNRMIQRRKDEEAERERREHPVRPVQKQAG